MSIAFLHESLAQRDVFKQICILNYMSSTNPYLIDKNHQYFPIELKKFGFEDIEINLILKALHYKHDEDTNFTPNQMIKNIDEHSAQFLDYLMKVSISDTFVPFIAKWVRFVHHYLYDEKKTETDSQLCFSYMQENYLTMKTLVNNKNNEEEKLKQALAVNFKLNRNHFDKYSLTDVWFFIRSKLSIFKNQEEVFKQSCANYFNLKSDHFDEDSLQDVWNFIVQEIFYHKTGQ